MRPSSRGSRTTRRPALSLGLELLERRDLPTSVVGPHLPETFTDIEPNDTLDLAVDLGNLSVASALHVHGAIGNSPAAAADVDWYRFTLDRPEAVRLTAFDPDRQVLDTLNLFVKNPFDPADPYTRLGYRRLNQAAGLDPADGTRLDRQLAAGTYYVAVSGAGNEWFSPFLADSGYDGQAGDYYLDLTATPLNLAPSDGPVILASDPAPDSILSSSPDVLRIDLSAPLSPDMVLLGDNVRLIFSATGNFGDGNDQDVPLGMFNVNDYTAELQVSPAAPLAPGFYRLVLAGNMETNFSVLTDANFVPLGATADSPSGQDFQLTFQVDGVGGNTAPGAGADDTPAGAHELGDVAGAGLVQVQGMIGVDPTDPVPFNPSDVNLYHFHIGGPGRFAFGAEVFAQRIGSPLNPGISLFVRDSADGLLHLVAGNDDTRNPITASNRRSLPLFADAALFCGLTEGDYYLAVSSRDNVPDPDLGLLPGSDGIFDPAVSQSGSAGSSTGSYVLNLKVWHNETPPSVVAVTPAPDSTLDSPPTRLSVRFSEPVNLQQLAFRAFERTAQGSLTAVYVRGPDGTLYYPRLESYDVATSQAVFLMLDRLPPGTFELHLSGALGLADFAGNPLAGNSPNGDYVVPFTVAGERIPTPWLSTEPNDSPAHAQDLGVLFPHELEDPGVIIARNTGTQADTADSYRFTLLQDQAYFFVLTGTGLPAGVRLTLRDAAGAELDSTLAADGASLNELLNQGTYVIRVSGWATGEAANVAYQLKIALGGSPENPQPLTFGPAPALRLLLTPVPPPQPPPPAIKVQSPDPQPPAPVDILIPTAQPDGRVPTSAITVIRLSAVNPAAPAVKMRLDVPPGLLAALGSGLIGPNGAGDGAGSQSAALPNVQLGEQGAPPEIKLASASTSGGSAAPTEGPGAFAEINVGRISRAAAEAPEGSFEVPPFMHPVLEFLHDLWQGFSTPAAGPVSRTLTNCEETGEETKIAASSTRPEPEQLPLAGLLTASLMGPRRRQSTPEGRRSHRASWLRA